MNVLEENFINWVEAKKILEEKSKEKALGYEQKNALEHLKKFSKLSGKKSKELEEKLRQIEKLKDRHIVSIINIQPQDVDDLRILFANEIINLSEEEKKNIISIAKKFG